MFVGNQLRQLDVHISRNLNNCNIIVYTILLNSTLFSSLGLVRENDTNLVLVNDIWIRSSISVI